MRILIAIPCMDTMPTPAVESLLRMEKPDGTNIKFHPGSLVYDARNLLSLHAIENKYDYVMWIDSDMIVPPDTIPRLLADAQEHNAQIVTGLYVKRSYPTAPVLYDKITEPKLNENGQLVKQNHEYVNYPRDSVFPVAGCGFGCVLTSVPLLKRVWDEHGPAFTPLPWLGEDFAFCYRLQKMNVPILCDSNIRCGHVGTFIYSDVLLNRGDDD